MFKKKTPSKKASVAAKAVDKVLAAVANSPPPVAVKPVAVADPAAIELLRRVFKEYEGHILGSAGTAAQHLMEEIKVYLNGLDS